MRTRWITLYVCTPHTLHFSFSLVLSIFFWRMSMYQFVFYTTLAIANFDVRPFWWWCVYIVYTLCGMRPVDLRFFAYVYNVYNRRANVFVAVFFCVCLCLYVVWLLAARAPFDDIFPTNMCTSRSICWPFHLVEKWKSTDW